MFRSNQKSLVRNIEQEIQEKGITNYLKTSQEKNLNLVKEALKAKNINSYFLVSLNDQLWFEHVSPDNKSNLIDFILKSPELGNIRHDKDLGGKCSFGGTIYIILLKKTIF